MITVQYRVTGSAIQGEVQYITLTNISAVHYKIQYRIQERAVECFVMGLNAPRRQQSLIWSEGVLA